MSRCVVTSFVLPIWGPPAVFSFVPWTGSASVDGFVRGAVPLDLIVGRGSNSGDVVLLGVDDGDDIYMGSDR